jgi:hypothetical protein
MVWLPRTFHSGEFARSADHCVKKSQIPEPKSQVGSATDRSFGDLGSGIWNFSEVFVQLWFGNFDFESGLTNGGGGRSFTVARLNAELSPLLIAAAQDGDALWLPEPVPHDYWEGMAARGMPRIRPIGPSDPIPAGATLSPWGWNDELLRWGQARTLQIDAPPIEVVRLANSRRFSATWEQQTGTGIPGAAACFTMEQVCDAIRALAGGKWVIKAEFSHAARERLLGAGDLTESAASWVRKRLQRDGAVFFEPWVERVAEAGLQWTVPKEGSPRLEAITPLLCHLDGRYLGSLFQTADQSASTDDSRWSAAIEPTERVAAHLQSLGYFGPLGIDVMQYRLGDELRLRSVQDVNARWTMGRLALGWRPLVPLSESAAWIHGPPPESWSSNVRQAVISSPAVVGDSPVRHCTAVCMLGTMKIG